MIAPGNIVSTMTLNDPLADELPAGSEFQQIAFANQPPTGQPVIVEFPPAIQRWGVLLKSHSTLQEALPETQLTVLSIPLATAEKKGPSSAELLTTVRQWVESSSGKTRAACLLITLQGTQIFWAPGRVVVIAAEERLEAIRIALIEASYYDAELSDIERVLGETWPQLEADLPLAFEFSELALPRRKQLLQRFQQVMLIRARQARIAPHVHCPHTHPPTLASQVGERLRERTRLAHRHEFLDEQIEVFEHVYEQCSERTSDFMLARSGNMLEWVIILLLVVQVLLSLFEIMSSLGT